MKLQSIEFKDGKDVPAGRDLRLYVDGVFAGLARMDEDGAIRVKAMLLENDR